MMDAVGAESMATLYITILGSGVNDPNALADSTVATESGGTLNTTLGLDPSGNLLSNDSSPTGSSLSVDEVQSEDEATSSTVATNTVVNGRYGQLTISTDGSYDYVVDNTHSQVEALRDNTETLIDPFIYTLADAMGLKDIASFDVKIQGANDAPVAANDSSIAVEAGGVLNSTLGFNPTGAVLANDTDVDDLLAELRVTAIRLGNVEGAGTGGSVGTAFSGMYGTLTISADGTYAYNLDNDNTTVNNLSAGQTLIEYFNYEVTDRNGTALSDTAVLSITIEGMDDLVQVNNIFINESSPYAVFTVSGTAGQTVSLALSDTQGLPDYDAKTTLSGNDADIGQSLEYYDGIQWVDYAGATPPSIPNGDTLLVRVGVNQDSIYEGNESFSLVATADNVATGIGTINDEGEGAVFLPTNTSGEPNLPTDSGYPPTLDDDRDDDGDGVTNSDEIIDGTGPADPCDYMLSSITQTITSTVDCDGDGVTDADEINGTDGDPLTTADNTDPTDPCDYNTSNQDFTQVSTAWKALDCDGDGVTNGTEVDPDGDGTAGGTGTNGGATDPTDPCDYNTGDITLMQGGDWLTADCDGDGVTNGQETTDGTDPTDGCAYNASNQDFTQVSTAWKALDCDGDGVTNGTEVDPDGDGTAGRDPGVLARGLGANDPATDPLDFCDYNVMDQDYMIVTQDWKDADCDGDGVTNANEVDPDGDGTAGGTSANGSATDPKDPCDYNTGDITLAQGGDWLTVDCDGDGVTNGIEVDPDGDGTAGGTGTNGGATDPTDPCDYNTGDITLMQGGDWLTADCDGDGNPNPGDNNLQTPTATDDMTFGEPGSQLRLDILFNDDFLDNNDPNNIGSTTLTRVGGSAAGGLSFDIASGELIYTPTEGEVGSSITIEYEVCNMSPDPAVCARATATITVRTNSGEEVDIKELPALTTWAKLFLFILLIVSGSWIIERILKL